jgi:hypothetical protein
LILTYDAFRKAKKLEKQHGKEKKEMKKNKKMQQRVAAAQIRAAQKKKAAQSAVVGADGNIDIDSHPFLKKIGPYRYAIKKGFVPDMNVEGCFYATECVSNQTIRCKANEYLICSFF